MNCLSVFRRLLDSVCLSASRIYSAALRCETYLLCLIESLSAFPFVGFDFGFDFLILIDDAASAKDSYEILGSLSGLPIVGLAARTASVFEAGRVSTISYSVSGFLIDVAGVNECQL